jgi:hypothetical protein
MLKVVKKRDKKYIKYFLKSFTSMQAAPYFRYDRNAETYLAAEI